MTSLFSDFSMIWLAKALAKPIRRRRDAVFAPFKALHDIRWAAPWDMTDRNIREGCG